MKARARFASSSVVKAAVLGVVALGVVAPAGQAKTSWVVSGTVHNNTGSTAENCGPISGSGCLFAYNWTTAGGISSVTPPTSPIVAGSSGTFGFVANDLFEGADQYIDYTTPSNSEYEVIAEDDVDAGGYAGGGNYVGCQQSTPQHDLTAVCSASWGGTEQMMTPTITFGPSAQAPLPSVGQRCSATMGGSTPVLTDCVATGQVGPPDQRNAMTIVVRTLTQDPMYVVQAGGGQGCRVGGPTYPQTCTMFTGPGKSMQIGSLNNGSSASYSVEIMATAIGSQPPDSFTPDPNQLTQATTTGTRALSISPKLVRPTRRGGLPIRKGSAANGRGASISYRSTHEATTVFSLARATRGVRRGDSCVRSGAAHPRGPRCTVWVTLPHRDVQSRVIEPGVKQGARCLAAPRGKHGGVPCRRRSTLRGHFLHRDSDGKNTVELTGRLAGRRLQSGSYRLAATTRTRRAGRTSAPAATRFTIAR